MIIRVPELALVALMGPSGSGKSTFAAKHFGRYEVLSSDFCRGLVSNDENDQAATTDAFDLLHYVARTRLARGLLTVVDATNVQREARKPIVALAREHDVLPVAIVLDLPEKTCRERNRSRRDRDFGEHVIRRQVRDLRGSLRHLKREGFRHVFVLSSTEEVDAAEVVRQPLWNNLKHLEGPFDIIGDVHGCLGELVALLGTLGYTVTESAGQGSPALAVVPPQGRTAIFLGDLVDRGPDTPGVLQLVMGMVAAGSALCVPGNHDIKLVKALRGRNVQIRHGLAESLEQIARQPESFRAAAADFLDRLVSHYVLDDGRLVVAHAGMKEKLQGRGSQRVREFALYGETTGETDAFGLPIRHDWAAAYRGRAAVVYGHTPVPTPEWLNNTINIDTGCVFGGRLTALRYPERELVSVAARHVYAEPVRSFLPENELPPLTGQQRLDDVLDIGDVTGKRVIATRLRGNVTVREENATAALEIISRFAVDPKWLIYLPPTMSPAETSKAAGHLEHPAEAFAYYRHEGMPTVVCQEKHMGSRAVVIVCRDADAAARAFGVSDGSAGIVYTRTGRRFFTSGSFETEFLDRLRSALGAADAWTRFDTDWVCLDAELMPWSAKASELVRQQYAAVGAAGRASLLAVISVLERTNAGAGATALLDTFRARAHLVQRYTDAYRRYCWDVESVADLRCAPFHIMATEGRTCGDRDHRWHMETLAQVCRADAELLLATDHRVVDLTDPDAQDEATAWWTELTARGGEGMVVKPLEFIARGRRGVTQPAVKVRGIEYLRIIYGPDYTEQANLDRLRSRALSHKRSMALREFALGVEGLERFARKEPLRRMHECVFGVLALESEPVDPRL